LKIDDCRAQSFNLQSSIFNSVMPYFLDGNNLIGHALGASRPSEENRQSLVSEVADRLRRTRATAVLFFDGPGNKRTSLGSLSIRECGGEGADDAILREIGRSAAPREIVVVTADRELGRRVRDGGAKTLSSRGLLEPVRGVEGSGSRRVGRKGGRRRLAAVFRRREESRPVRPGAAVRGPRAC
jgi:predicted RNA-binding protein with PIN domain